ncbi:MAG: MBL fold metallo-hydrolase [Brachymonas sp.]|mgnify:CR=1 FL=1|nr:MBL fold metallo-hydrolase [Brachymonas sp.]
MLKITLVSLKWLLIFVVLLAAGTYLFIRFHPVFGGQPDAQSMAKIRQSPHFNGEVFVNLEPTEIQLSDGDNTEKPSIIGWLSSVTNPPAGKHPAEPVPTLPLDNAALKNDRFVWLGHSTLLFKLANKTLLLDPVFNRASPIFLGGAPFAMTHTYTVGELPPIDAVLISHDHYDHLDYRAIQELDSKTGHFYVSLGVKAHLQRWGVADSKITEMDWHEQAQFGDLRLTLAPARHFSGRTLHNRNSTLWGAWIVRSANLSLFFNGDSGYGKHFAMIGERYGPFDVAFMENGAYNPKGWPLVHMTPEQSAQAAADIRTKVAVPIHWGKFDLAYHTWKDPIQRFLQAAANQPYQTATPQIGQVFDLQNLPQGKWWESVK